MRAKKKQKTSKNKILGESQSSSEMCVCVYMYVCECVEVEKQLISKEKVAEKRGATLEKEGRKDQCWLVVVGCPIQAMIAYSGSLLQHCFSCSLNTDVSETSNLRTKNYGTYFPSFFGGPSVLRVHFESSFAASSAEDESDLLLKGGPINQLKTRDVFEHSIHEKWTEISCIQETLHGMACLSLWLFHGHLIIILIIFITSFSNHLSSRR